MWPMGVILVSDKGQVVGKLTSKLIGCCFTVSGVGSVGTGSRGSIGESSRVYCPHNECCHAHEDQEPAELKKIKKV